MLILKKFWKTLKFWNNDVFTDLFRYRLYSQLHLHITGDYNCLQAGIGYQTTEHVVCRPIYTQRVSLVLTHSLAKVRNFKRVASKMQCEHATVFSRLLGHCWALLIKELAVKTPLLFLTNFNCLDLVVENLWKFEEHVEVTIKKR